MPEANPRFVELKQRLCEVHDLQRIGSVLHWDQQTMMPPGGASARAEQLATLQGVAHERFVADEVGALLEELRPYEESLDDASDEASLLRVVRRDYEKERRVPVELRSDLTRAAAQAVPDWVRARETSDFSLFLPHLERALELKRRYVECFDGERAYDVLLDDYEPGMKTSEVETVFDRLKEELVPFIAEVADADISDACLHGHFPVERQRDFELEVLGAFGFDPRSWRLDLTEHPFATGSGLTDIRITTNRDPSNLTSLFAAMHECGHGLYERQISPSLERTPICDGTSMAVHESQSRMWENLVGRSRPFWRHYYPRLQGAFPEQLGGVDEVVFYRAINRVQPSLIRIHADEVTYNLHIVLRFELEQELLAGSLAPADLPEAWNARMRDYLGVEVPDDAHGVLQDIHWAGGSFGYFPTYSLGNVVSAQLWERIREAIPDLDERIEAGSFGELREWLRENVHRHGRKFTTPELLERICDGPLDAEPYLVYLKGKLGDLAAATA